MNSGDPSGNTRHERFHARQYYYAVEDERMYMNEYTSIINRYNDFIINGNAMFARMEQTLRENISRSVTRQMIYYPDVAEPRQVPLRRTNQDFSNLFSMLYTIPIGGRAAPAAPAAGPPTNDQIARATLNTVFANILSPVNATCPISRDEFNDESEITMIRGCSHIFNRASLREWFVSHSTCPMCRSDIRMYRGEAAATAATAAAPRAAVRPNMTIDSVDENHVTFSYDLPRHYNNDQIYRDILNTITGMTAPPPSSGTRNNDDDDIMEVD
jgi:hypothetical protein